jgi:hypothetical protein
MGLYNNQNDGNKFQGLSFHKVTRFYFPEGESRVAVNFARNRSPRPPLPALHREHLLSRFVSGRVCCSAGEFPESWQGQECPVVAADWFARACTHLRTLVHRSCPCSVPFPRTLCGCVSLTVVWLLRTPTIYVVQ